MNRLLLFTVPLAIASLLLTADNSDTKELEAAERARLFQRFLAELRQAGVFTNLDMSTTNLVSDYVRRYFDYIVVHPSFGLHWDEVPPPTSTGSNAMAAVTAFVTTNGWSMRTGAWAFHYPMIDLKPIRGLPWEAIRDREFPAFTHQQILYVVFPGGGHNSYGGVAYNPSTNAFPPAIRGFKHIGQHWYVWTQPEDPIPLSQQYEGRVR